jgi:hypothetical protein
MRTRREGTRRFTAPAFAGLALVFAAWFIPGQAWAVGSWTGVINEPAGVTIEEMILLSDGSVMGQDSSSGETNWWQLTPDTTGSYITGKWKQLASMHYARNAYGKTMLQDGRVLVVGDENDHNGTTAEVFDPQSGAKGKWTNLPLAGVGFADCETVILPDGNVLISPVSWLPYPKFITVIYNPTTNGWSFPGSSLAYQDEASWVKMPDDSILTIDYNNTTSERFIPALGQWIADASVPVTIYDQGEMGPGFLLPDGRAFFLGGSGHTALYTASPLGGTNQGSWAKGPDIPSGRVTCDAPGAMMVNGRVLCAVGGKAADGGSPAPTWFYEYDYKDHTASPNGTFKPTSSPTDSTIGSSNNVPSGHLSFLDLPDGTVLACNSSGGKLYVYTPDTPPLAAGKPTIESVDWNVNGDLHISGTLFNGISQGAAFGDEGQDASNYPLVSFTDGIGNVYYGRTYNWSSTGVQTGGKVVTTEVTLPSAVFSGPGTFSLQVIANGIASDPLTFYGPVWVDFTYGGSVQNGTYNTPFNKLAKGVSAVVSGGTIAIKPGSSSETPTISKPMNIVAVGGAATVGH